MKDFDRLYIRFKQFGGWRLVIQYARMGVLWIGVKEIICCAVKGKSMKAAYPKITERVDEILRKKYGPSKSPLQGDLQDPPTSLKGRLNNQLIKLDGQYESPFMGERKSVIWFCWLQGMEEAPELVHACLASLRSLPDAEIVVVDKDNYREYVEFPEYVLEKYHKGWIPYATMSDMLRLALLSKHGGVWIDSTVLATYNERHKVFWDKILNSEFYLYRYFRNGRVNGISTWFIAAKPNNPIINETLQMMYAYWKDYDCLVEYYLIHLFIGMSAKRHPEYIHAMPKGNSYNAIMLGGALEKSYNEDAWRELTDHVLFHKMTYRHTEKAKAIKGSYYNHIIQRFTQGK